MTLLTHSKHPDTRFSLRGQTERYTRVGRESRRVSRLPFPSRNPLRPTTPSIGTHISESASQKKPRERFRETTTNKQAGGGGSIGGGGGVRESPENWSSITWDASERAERKRKREGESERSQSGSGRESVWERKKFLAAAATGGAPD